MVPAACEPTSKFYDRFRTTVGTSHGPLDVEVRDE
jgi:hypothetical protein